MVRALRRWQLPAQGLTASDQAPGSLRGLELNTRVLPSRKGEGSTLLGFLLMVVPLAANTLCFEGSVTNRPLDLRSGYGVRIVI